MSTTVASQPNQSETSRNNTPRRRPRHRHGPRGGGDNSSRTSTANPVQQQSVQTPQSLPVGGSSTRSVDLQAPENASHSRGGDGRRGGRRRAARGGRGGRQRLGDNTDSIEERQTPSRSQRNMHVAGQRRQFGGQLTSVDETTTPYDGTTQLHAGAPEFRPGEQKAQGDTTSRQKNLPRKRRLSKSKAPDIATRTHEDIDNGQYECPICTEDIQRNSKGWSCRTCWTVFHLKCIKKWSTNEGAAMARRQSQDGEIPPPRQWRCPGCNLPKDTLPSTFTCWCEKEIDPKSLPGLPPFSCGQTCSRSLQIPQKCPHPCPLTCHAGPCPPCTQMGPTQSCYCGREAATQRCIETDYDHGWSCGQTCDELLPCGEHECPRECHEGLCGACEVRIDSRCYCGQVTETIPCCDRGDDHPSARALITGEGKDIIDGWIGMFECSNTCNREFDCGVHRCEKSCHPQDAEQAHCPRSPDVVTHCPCGKTKIQDISESPRKSCRDPIPNCSEPCRKPLACGHLCEQLCHSGECSPCFQTVSIACRCRRTSTSTMCHQGREEPPQCMRVCRVTLNCGRHNCDERCCPGERRATERLTNKKKLRPLNVIESTPRPVDDGFEAEHICTRTCGRLLKCGNHTCQELCHKGACGSCREAIFEEIACNCGRTVLQPPLACGTQPPPCRFPCERLKDCGHPQVVHNCHQDNEECPKCPFLTTKQCLCAKNVLKNQQCWLTEVRCGEICNSRLKCGHHRCRKACHRPGECEDAGKSAGCQQACGKEKKCCGHPCSEQCHSPYPCKENKPCDHRIFITCPCQRIKQETRCNATKDSQGNNEKVLKCDEECARLERNRKLASALNVDPSHDNDHIPYSTETLSLFSELDQSWAQTQEKAFRIMAADPDAKRLRFKPSPKPQRAFLHYLAEDFGLDSESMDPEPHRHVAVFKTPRFVAAPMKSLLECQRIRRAQQSTSVPAAISTKAKASNVEPDPYNAFLLTNPRFGLTISDLSSTARTVLESDPTLTFTISFLPSEEVVLKANPSLPVNVNGTGNQDRERALDRRLQPLKPPLTELMSSHNMGSIQLARVDASLNVLRRESDGAAGSGWSQIAAKAARNVSLRSSGVEISGNSFGVLSGSGSTMPGSGKVAFSTKKKVGKTRKESVADDWEAAEAAEEEKERAESGNVSAAEGSVTAEGETVEDAPPAT